MSLPLQGNAFPDVTVVLIEMACDLRYTSAAAASTLASTAPSMTTVGSHGLSKAGGAGEKAAVQVGRLTVPSALQVVTPAIVYPELQAGVHVCPVSIVVGQLPILPFVGAVTVQTPVTFVGVGAMPEPLPVPDLRVSVFVGPPMLGCSVLATDSSPLGCMLAIHSFTAHRSLVYTSSSCSVVWAWQVGGFVEVSMSQPWDLQPVPSLSIGAHAEQQIAEHALQVITVPEFGAAALLAAAAVSVL